VAFGKRINIGKGRGGGGKLSRKWNLFQDKQHWAGEEVYQFVSKIIGGRSKEEGVLLGRVENVVEGRQKSKTPIGATYVRLVNN